MHWSLWRTDNVSLFAKRQRYRFHRPSEKKIDIGSSYGDWIFETTGTKRELPVNSQELNALVFRCGGENNFHTNEGFLNIPCHFYHVQSTLPIKKYLFLTPTGLVWQMFEKVLETREELVTSSIYASQRNTKWAQSTKLNLWRSGRVLKPCKRPVITGQPNLCEYLKPVTTAFFLLLILCIS